MSGLYVEAGQVFTTSYHEGYNLNFEITVSEAQSLLPAGFTPMALKIVESDPVDRYYLSLYMAVLDSDETEPVTRIDLFTYATDPEGEPTLQFVSSYISVPQMLIDLGMMAMFKEIFDFFARDSATGLPAYPHYYTETLTADHDTFSLEYEGSFIQSSPCAPVSPTGTFTREFITANSQIYRNAYDKNVNYFNQSFISANVETRSIDPACLSYGNLEGFHPMLSGADLKSIQFYGSADKEITWYYQTCSNDYCQDPFIF